MVSVLSTTWRSILPVSAVINEILSEQHAAISARAAIPKFQPTVLVAAHVQLVHATVSTIPEQQQIHALVSASATAKLPEAVQRAISAATKLFAPTTTGLSTAKDQHELKSHEPIQPYKPSATEL